MVQLVEALRYKRESRGSNPDSVIGIFHEHNPSGCAMALGSTHPLTEMSTRNIYCGVQLAGPKGLQPSCADYHEFWEHEPPENLRACTGIELTLPLPSPLLLLLRLLLLLLLLLILLRLRLLLLLLLLLLRLRLLLLLLLLLLLRLRLLLLLLLLLIILRHTQIVRIKVHMNQNPLELF